MYLLWIYVVCLTSLNAHLLQSEGRSDAISLYKARGTKITCELRWLFLSGSASMEAIKETKNNGKDAILWRGMINRPGKILGFIMSFIKLYKGATIFDTYIDTDTHLPIECIEYKNPNEITKHIYYDREHQSLKSLKNGKVLTNIPSDIQDGVSTLVNFWWLANNQEMVPGKTLAAHMNIGVKSYSEVIVEVTNARVAPNGVIYTITSRKLPDILKYPTLISVQLLDDGKRVIPVSAVASIKLPILGKIRIKGIIKVRGIKTVNCE